jgi:hypothetical protein
LRSNGDTVVNGIATLTGVPVFDYKCSAISTTADLTSAFNLIKAADDSHYIMGAQTSGGADTTFGSCGIANGHAYSIIAAFTMTDASNVAHKCLLMRNPWGNTYYSGKWNKNDGNWT